MNTICLQKNYGYNSRKDATNLQSRSNATGHNAFTVPINSISENDHTKSQEIQGPGNIFTNEADKMFLLNQRELENIAFANRRNQESGNEKEVYQETELSKNQEDVLRIIQLMGVELKNKINWNSDGSCKLTDEQIKDLKERYDVENLSEGEYYNLLVELVNLNVISGDDFEKQFIRDIPPEVSEYGGMVTATSSNDYGTERNDYLDKFLKDAEMFEYYFRAIEERKSVIHETSLVKSQEYYKEQRERSHKLADIFQQIQRKEQDNKIITKSEKSFNGLDILGPSAPDEVKEAWNKAEKECGINGYGMDSGGKLTCLTSLFAMSLVSAYNGGGRDILGNTVYSAKTVVKKALDSLGIPQNSEEKKEKLFYEAFLRFLN
jgi:hypothetical protein